MSPQPNTNTHKPKHFHKDGKTYKDTKTKTQIHTQAHTNKHTNTHTQTHTHTHTHTHAQTPSEKQYILPQVSLCMVTNSPIR